MLRTVEITALFVSSKHPLREARETGTLAVDPGLGGKGSAWQLSNCVPRTLVFPVGAGVNLCVKVADASVAAALSTGCNTRQ
jgi:hypothetical protein